MSPKYEPLPRNGETIRLLRLRPSIDKAAPIRSELLEYSLGIAGESHRYEALSYVWGDPDVTRTIIVNEAEFRVTVNLFAALHRLRSAMVDRLLWVDAICINQDDTPEKENQIPLMRMIYGSAANVIVWLGAEAEKSNGAFNFIRLMAEVREDGIEGYDEVYDSEEESSTGDDDYGGGDGGGGYGGGDSGDGGDGDVEKKARYTIVLAPPKPQRPVQSEDNYQAVLELLRRPWFRRIWVLQEVGLARSIQIICGPIQMDGYIFSTGVGNSGISFSEDPGLEAVASSVVSLMKSAIFRPRYTPDTAGGLPLVDLLNMYHKREASKSHDKVYALLGLCNEDLETSGLRPDYSVSWAELLSRLIRHVFGTEVQVDTRQGIAFITAKGYVFGHVSSTHRDRIHKERQYVKVGHNTIAKSMGLKLHFSVGMPAVPVERNDIVCYIRGSSRLWVIRRVGDYFTIITSVPGLEGFPAQVRANRHKNPLLWGKFYLRDLFLAWDLGPGHGPTVPLIGGDGVLNFRGPKHAVAKHRHAMALVSSDGKRVVKEEPHEVNEGIRMLELAFGETHDETLAARRDLALLYVTRNELKKAEDTMRGVIKSKARAKGRDYRSSILDSTTTLATIFMFYSSLADSSTGPGRPLKLYSEPWEVSQQFVGILKKIRKGRRVAKDDVMSALKYIEGDGLTGLLKLFFSGSNPHELITEDVVKRIVGSVENRREVMRFLLNQLGDDLPISEDVMKEVAKDNKYGIEMLLLLISRRGKGLPLSEGVLMLAAANQLRPHPGIVYKKHRNAQVETINIPVVQILDLLESRGDSLPITEEILMETARNRETGCLMMRDFARRLGDSYTIPEVILVTAVRNWSVDDVEGLTTLISRQWNASSIPEGILLAAAKHRFHSTDLLRGLFDKAGHDLSITTDVLIATVTNTFRFQNTTNLRLIGEKQRHIVIPEEVMAAVIDAYGDIWDAAAIELINLLLKHTSFVLSEQAVEWLLDEIQLPQDDELMSILFESRENLRISKQLQDRICDLERLRAGFHR